MEEKIKYAIEYLNYKKIIWGEKTVYENNKPVKTVFMPIKITKKDQFYRANSKIVSRNFAFELIRLGMATT